MDKEELISHLERHLKVIDKNPTLDIYSCVLFYKNQIISYNMCETLITKFECRSSFVINATELYVLLKNIKAKEISISKESENNVIVSYNRNNCCFQTYPLEDFVYLNPSRRSEEDQEIIIDEKVYSSIMLAAKFTSIDDLRDNINYVFIGKKHIVGTDGSNMKYISHTLNIEKPALIYRTIIEKYKDLIRDSTMIYNQELERILFLKEDQTLYVKINSAVVFPNYESVLPNNFNRSFIVSRTELIEHVNSCMIMNKNVFTITLSVFENKLVVNSFDQTKTKYNGLSFIKHLKSGEAYFDVNPKNLMKILKSIDTSFIIVELNADENDIVNRAICINNDTIIVPLHKLN